MSSRKKPYTLIGIGRVPCSRCGCSSVEQWQICADGNIYRGLCLRCDILMNRLVMRFVFGRSREHGLKAYEQKLRRLYQQ